MGKPSQPAAPNPQQTAQAQEQVNQQSALQTAELNNINQYSPLGSSTYQITGYNPDGMPQYSQTTALNQPEQNILNNTLTGQQNLGNIALGMQNQVANSYAQPLNTSSIPSVASTVTNGAGSPGAMQQAENAAYGMQTQYLDPQFAQRQESLQNQLANEGVTQGSQAYNTAMFNLGQQENQAYGNAGMQAVQAGQNEQNTLFGQGLESANLQNQASAQGMQQLFALTDQPLNEYNALMSGAQVQMPQFQGTNTSQVAPTNYGSIVNGAYQNQLAGYNTAMQGYNNLFSLGGNLGALAIMAG